MAQDEGIIVGAGVPVAAPLGETANIVGHTGGPEFLVGSGDKMSVVKKLDGVFVSTSQVVRHLRAFVVKRRVLAEIILRQVRRVVPEGGR